MPKNDVFFKMRTCDDLLFGRNESQRHVWRPVGGRGWTSFTSDIVVLSNLGGQGMTKSDKTWSCMKINDEMRQVMTRQDW